MASNVTVKRRAPGIYDLEAGDLRFQVNRSIIRWTDWQLVARGEAAFKALGEPERPPIYQSLSAAIVVVEKLSERES